MPLKEIFAPHLNRSVKMGRRRPVAFGPRLFLRNYLDAELPPVPPTCDFSKPAASALSNLYLNDKLGDCVIAAGYHVVGVETGNAKNLFTAADKQIVADYGAIGGYVPGNPNTDNGCDEVTALNYWTERGFADKTKSLGWLAINPTNRQEVTAAQYLFENLFFAMELPDEWIDPVPEGPGFTWDVAGPSVPENGHAVAGVGYSAEGVLIDSWGLIGTLTWDAIATYCSEANGGGLYAMLTPDQLEKAQTKAPNGIDWSALIQDFNTMGGKVQPPRPTPPMPKPPKPPVPKPPKPPKPPAPKPPKPPVPKPPKPPVPKPPKPPKPPNPAPPSTGGTGTTGIAQSAWVPPPSYQSPIPQPIFEAGQSLVDSLAHCPKLGVVAVMGLVAVGIVTTGIVGVVALSERKS